MNNKSHKDNSRKYFRKRKNSLKKKKKTNKKGKKEKKEKKEKTKKTKKKSIVAGVKKEHAAKYIGLLNSALNHIHQGKIDDVFLSGDHILWTSGFLEEGSKRGFELMKSGKYQLDPNCNIVCVSNSLITWQIIQLDYHELSDLQKLYLFFLDYLNRSGNERTDKTLPLEYAIKNIEKELSLAKEYHKRKVGEKAKAKSIKTALKSIAKIETRKQDVLDRYKSQTTTGFNNTVDICGQMDCIYLNEDKFIENPDLEKPIEKFCNHMILIFKGIIWLLMKEFSESEIHMYNIQSGGVNYYCDHVNCLESVIAFETKADLERHMKEDHPELEPDRPVLQTGNPLEAEPELEPEPEPESEYEYERRIELDLSIHALLVNTDSVLIPSYSIYGDKDNYEIGDSIQMGDEWLYTNLRRVGSEFKIDKILAQDLKEQFYLTATLDDGYEAHEAEAEDEGTALERLMEFVKGNHKPLLSNIQIINPKLPNGSVVPQLIEEIKDSITQHWYVAPKKEICDNVAIQMAF